MDVVFILGTSRSGTTWLAKIFDSNPDVIYRHEPDIVLRNASLPVFVRRDEVARYEVAARCYLDQLIHLQCLKSAGSLPVFWKANDNRWRYAARVAATYTLRGVEFLLGDRDMLRRFPIPGVPNVRRGHGNIVIKSVSACGRARLFAKAVPDSRTIFILRDAFGHVASVMRGRALGKFGGPLPVHEVLQVEQAQRYGLTAERWEAMTDVQQLAWHWAILNEKALEDLHGLSNVRIVRYHDLVNNPVEQARELFEFCHLQWHNKTATFIQKSSQYRGRDRYYQVYKNSRAVVDRWRSTLSADQQDQIAEVVAATSLGSYLGDGQSVVEFNLLRDSSRDVTAVNS